ncbi:MAG: DUF4445 domain-containing protein [Rhodobacteraceae bacterium]|nr:MAG: DUF4445 domain-containing protein [Paracoccaceae bacterium]
MDDKPAPESDAVGAAVASDDVLVIFTPSGKRGRVARGTPVLTAARQLGVDLDSVCGGRGICSKCQVAPAFGAFPKHGLTARAEALSPWNDVEQRYADKRGMADGRRLGCQARLMGDMVIDVPPESQTHRQVIRKDLDAAPITLDPLTRLHYVEVAEPDMHEPTGDFERLSAALATQWGVEGATVGLSTLQALQPALRAGGWAATVAVHRAPEGPRVLHVWPGFHEGAILGVAFDVGSTTIACHLCDLGTGAVLASAGRMNPQIRFGEDLMSRVSWSMMNPDGAADMTRAAREAVNDLIGEVCAAAGAARDQVFEAVFVGNPVMHHLLLGIDPVELGGAPFALAVSGALRLSAREIGVSAHPEAQVYVLPCIAGHVGADAAAVALAAAPHRADALTLVVDVGTNAEILLGDREGVLACSSPTGPAFEGAQIASGQRAAPGAVERVRIDPATREPRFRVIGCDLWSDEPGFAEAVGPGGVTGICGSGIIEVLAEMRIAGLLDADGVIGSAEQTGSARCVPDGRTQAYVLWEAAGRRIAVTQNDVRAIQLAKAALYAGARLLMDERGVETVARVVLAGAFGAHISPLHAMVLGMIPDCPLDHVTSAGNAAGAGARMALLDAGSRTEIEALATRIVKVETAIEPRFQEHFVAAMALPHKTAAFPHLDAVVSLPAVAFKPGAEASSRRRRRG